MRFFVKHSAYICPVCVFVSVQVLVHGEQNEMMRLKSALVREYEDDSEYNIDIYTPRNTQTAEFYFRGEKMAKVVGSLASVPRIEGSTVSGVVIKRNFNYQIMAPSDLPSRALAAILCSTYNYCYEDMNVSTRNSILYMRADAYLWEAFILKNSVRSRLLAQNIVWNLLWCELGTYEILVSY